ncbi:hypothetical protein PybrP1_008576 [[Pythium] brassicae (nom. inval.)]|nr:hypothetical protein PybrP1_008576 [[Pythium] brassicae (nom. inval.)]
MVATSSGDAQLEAPDDVSEDESLDAHHADSVQRFAAQLRTQLLHWEPSVAAAAASDPRTRAFVDALTTIAALPVDALGMETRRLLVDSGECDGEAGDAAARVVAALDCRDVRLKCKAASALGSLCVSRVAGQRLLELHGAAALRSLARMATSRNRWAQADALAVLGWVVVIADERALAQVARLLPAVVATLRASVARGDAANDGDEEHSATGGGGLRRRHAEAASTEDASNLRVYALVLLLNFLQRDAGVFGAASQLQRPLLDAANAVVAQLNAADAAMDPAEFVEVARLTVTLLGLLVDQHEDVAARVLERRMLPTLLRLRQTLARARAEGLIGDGGVDGLAASDATDLEERVAAIVAAVVARR